MKIKKKTRDKIKYSVFGFFSGLSFTIVPLVFAHTDDINLTTSDIHNLITSEVYPSLDEYVPYDGVDVNVPDAPLQLSNDATTSCPTTDVISY